MVLVSSGAQNAHTSSTLPLSTSRDAPGLNRLVEPVDGAQHVHTSTLPHIGHPNMWMEALSLDGLVEPDDGAQHVGERHDGDGLAGAIDDVGTVQSAVVAVGGVVAAQQGETKRG